MEIKPFSGLEVSSHGGGNTLNQNRKNFVVDQNMSQVLGNLRGVLGASNVQWDPITVEAIQSKGGALERINTAHKGGVAAYGKNSVVLVSSEIKAKLGRVDIDA